MIITVTDDMPIVDQPCPYCPEQIKVGDQVHDESHHVRHVGCGPRNDDR